MESILTFLPAMKKTSAAEWAGPCPACGGGHDRFHVWTDSGKGGRYWCRQCGAKGDGIQFLRDYQGMSYSEACAVLGIGTPPRSVRTRRRDTTGTTGTRQNVPPVPLPSVTWKTKAAAFLADCQRDMEDRPEALCALSAARFIAPDAARACGVGYNDHDRWAYRTAWGLSPKSDKPDGGKLLLPRGIVIATLREGAVVSLAVRCPDEDREGTKRQKYHQVAGGANVAFIAGEAGRPVVLVESALDAVLVWQESFGQVTGVAPMGNSKELDAAALAVINAAPVAIAAPDNDEGGGLAFVRWKAQCPCLLLFPAVAAKDLGEMHKAALTWPVDESIPPVPYWLNAVMSQAGHNLTIPV